MAREEFHREDIMHEATALVPRVELRLPGHSESVIFGLRREGAASIFFGQDPVYHFNAAHELRRAYLAGDLIKAEKASAIRLRRVRADEEVQLQRCTLPSDEAESLLDSLHERLARLRTAVMAGEATIAAVFPGEADVLRLLRDWLGALPGRIRFAQKPHVQ